MKPGREFDSRQGHENFLCPGRAWFLLLPSWKYSLEVCVLLTSVSLKLIKIKINLIYATTSSWGKKWRVKGKWCRLILFFFLWSELFFLWSEFIRVQFYFIFIFLFDPSWFELILPGLAVRVDPVRLLYLPIAREVSTIAEEDRHRHFLFIVYYQHLRLVFWSWMKYFRSMLIKVFLCWKRVYRSLVVLSRRQSLLS